MKKILKNRGKYEKNEEESKEMKVFYKKESKKGNKN